MDDSSSEGTTGAAEFQKALFRFRSEELEEGMGSRSQSDPPAFELEPKLVRSPSFFLKSGFVKLGAKLDANLNARLLISRRF